MPAFQADDGLPLPWGQHEPERLFAAGVGWCEAKKPDLRCPPDLFSPQLRTRQISGSCLHLLTIYQQICTRLFPNHTPDDLLPHLEWVLTWPLRGVNCNRAGVSANWMGWEENCANFPLSRPASISAAGAAHAI